MDKKSGPRDQTRPEDRKHDPPPANSTKTFFFSFAQTGGRQGDGLGVVGAVTSPGRTRRLDLRLATRRSCVVRCNMMIGVAWLMGSCAMGSCGLCVCVFIIVIITMAMMPFIICDIGNKSQCTDDSNTLSLLS